MILFSTSKKNVIVHKVPACFNTLGISPYGGKNVWVGQGSCVGKTFQSENWQLPFKGLIIHTPLASNRITSHVGAVCGFGEEVVWLYKSCCHQCRWRNATVHESVVLMIFSCIMCVYVNSQEYANVFELLSQSTFFSRYLSYTSDHKFLGISLF